MADAARLPALASAPPQDSLTARLERRLAREILRGERSPGSHLPPVRALARELGVTVPTVQRVVARLEASGLVSARRGSGVRVNDPRRCGDLSLLPLWFDALRDEPQRAAGVLADFLELRRVAAARLIARTRRRLARVARRFAPLVAGLETARSLDDVVEADLAVTRAVLDEIGQFAANVLFHAAERLVREVPYVAEAMYADPAANLRSVRQLVAWFESDIEETELRDRIERKLAELDRKTVRGFRERLERLAARAEGDQ